MITKAFAVYDSKAKAFMCPFFVQATGLAIRSFADAVNDQRGDSMVCKHPEDFALYEVGAFDDSTGVLTPLEKHINLGLASSFKNVIPLNK